jgi:hypothetical protein
MFFLKRAIICLRVALRLGILTPLVARAQCRSSFERMGARELVSAEFVS